MKRFLGLYLGIITLIMTMAEREHVCASSVANIVPGAKGYKRIRDKGVVIVVVHSNYKWNNYSIAIGFVIFIVIFVVVDVITPSYVGYCLIIVIVTLAKAAMAPPLRQNRHGSPPLCCHVASHHGSVGAFMADLAGRRSVLFPKIQREAGET